MAAKALSSTDYKSKERDREQSESGVIPGVFMSAGFHAGEWDGGGGEGVVNLKKISFIGTLWITFKYCLNRKSGNLAGGIGYEDFISQSSPEKYNQ